MKRVGDLVPAFTPCEMCKSGWVLDPHERSKIGAMIRCPCWHAHQRKVLEALAASQKGKR